MKISTLVLAIILLFCLPMAHAQDTYFGKNKVQYRNFDWKYIQTDHFDIYFYDNAYDLAKFTADELEEAYDIVSHQLKYYVRSRIPVFVYNSHNDFQQTNIVTDEPSEGTQGFTEAFKKRIVVHFMGSYEEYRHLLHHELTHAVVYDMIYGEFFKAVLNPQRLFTQPLWLAEGYAEYSSNGGWAQRADMMVRDATINSYLRPPGWMGFMAYTEGYAMVKYIADNYGVDKISEIFNKGKALVSIDRALKSSIGLNSEELYDKFVKEMKERYWPDIALRQEPMDFATQLTNHVKDPSNYNEKPVYHPKGQMLAMFTDYNGYTEIHLISALDGKHIARLVKGERSADLESLRWYTSGISFSPDGEKMVFVSKANGEDALNFYSLKKRKIYDRKKFGLSSIISPAWSPDGHRIAFSALSQASRDLFLYDFDTDSLTRLTNDLYDDKDVSWYPDGKRLIFSSDRKHDNDIPPDTTGTFVYGLYDLQEMDVASRTITPIDVGDGANTEPVVSPDGERIAFISNRSGIDNIYVHYIDSARTIAVTNILTSAASPSWSPDGQNLAFSTFFKGGYDIYVIKDIVAKGDNGILVPTDFVLGKYDKPGDWARVGHTAGLLTMTEESADTAVPVVTDPEYPVASQPGDSEWGADDDSAAVEETTAVAGAADDAAQPADTAAVEAASPSDSAATEIAATPDSTTAEKPVTDSTAVEKPATDSTDTGEEEYVYKAPVSDESAFSPEGKLVIGDANTIMTMEPAVDSINADDLDNILPNGKYRVKPYKTKFTPDFISGGLQYDTFFGFQGQTVFAFSDYLGDHQIYIATDLVNTIDQSNIQFYYLYNRLRVDFTVGLFHTKNFYVDANDELFSDRFYGLVGGMSWPRSKFTRLELNAATYFIDRKYLDNIFLDSRNVRVSTAILSWINDTVLWGITGPVRGRRYKMSIEGATPIFGDESVNYYAGELDYRQYFSLGRPFSFAFRLAGGFSNGSTPKNYYIGGNTNKIGSVSVDNDVYNIENLYFSRVVTPLRGYDYYDIRGTRFLVTNYEIHFPFIDYFLMRYPLRLGLSSVTGALFLDMGAAWSQNSDFKGGDSEKGGLLGIKSGFGFGARANLGFLILRYDLAWRTDFNTVEPHTKHYFSLGANF